MYHLQPLEALFCGCGLFSILDTLRAGTRKRILQIVCLAMVVLAFVIEPERMYSGTYKIDKELEQYSQAACVDITGDLGSFTSGVQELLKFQEVCVVPDDSIELLVQYNTGENDTLVLFIGGRGLWQFVTANRWSRSRPRTWKLRGTLPDRAAMRMFRCWQRRSLNRSLF